MEKRRPKRIWVLYTILIMGVLMIFLPYLIKYYQVKRSTLQNNYKNECLNRKINEWVQVSRKQGFVDGAKVDEIVTDCLDVAVKHDKAVGTLFGNIQNITEKNGTKMEKENVKKKQEMCPTVSPLLKGPISILINAELDYNAKETNTSKPPLQNWPPTLEQVAVHYKDLELGGSYAGPRDCKCKTSVAVIVPFRDREMHLRMLSDDFKIFVSLIGYPGPKLWFFLYYIHQLLQRQQLCYVIIVAEQVGSEPFNKGQLMNSGFVYANRLMNFDCFIFHDVDTTAQDDRIPYTCNSDHVYHIAPYLDKYNYKINGDLTVGGAVAFTKEQFTAVNGYSDEYVGWGGEDDDMAVRIKSTKYTLSRLKENYIRFKMFKHKRDKGNPKNPRRSDRLRVAHERMKEDGLNSLNTSSVDVIKYLTHTRLKLKTFTPKYVKEVLNRP